MYIQKDKDKQSQELKLFEKFLKFPFHIMPIQQISDTLNRKIDKFYDLEFPPNWKSIHDG